MLKKDFLLKIESLQNEVKELLFCDSVPFDSPLYAFLQTAFNSLGFALRRSQDFNRDKL